MSEPCTVHTGHPLKTLPARWTWGAVRMRADGSRPPYWLAAHQMECAVG